MSIRQFLAVALGVTLAGLSGGGHLAKAADISYLDFSSIAGLNLAGDAAQAGSALRLSGTSADSTGAAWYTAKQAVVNGFETVFKFQITDQRQYNVGELGGDGFAFVVQNSDGSALGSTGFYMGYEIENSLAVEFDTFANYWWSTAPAMEPNNNHVGVQSRGTAQNTASYDGTRVDAFLGAATVAPNMSDGAIHTARISYLPGSLKVFVDDLVSPYLDVAVDLGTLLALEGGKAYVGFTAGGDTATENHDITQWEFASVPEPATFTMMALGLLGVAGCRRRPVHKAA
jgi:hypothetical protein